MTMAENPEFDSPGLTACPGCVARPATSQARTAGTTGETLYLSLPAIHCAGCIATVERGLLQRDDVFDARVNLNRKQVQITHASQTAPDTLIDHLTDLGVEARLLDRDALGTTNDTAGRALLIRIAIAGFAMMNVMLMSVAIWSGAEEATRTLFHWLSAAIALPAVVFAGQPFFRNAWTALKVGRLNMDVPISLALVLASAMSLFETAAGGHDAYFDAALSLTFFLLCGRYLDHRCRSTARSAARELAALEVPRVIRETATGRETIKPEQAQVGDHIVVLAGARAPVDGIVIAGNSTLDRALLTGESLPVAAQRGSTVNAGELNLSGPLTLLAKAVGTDTSLRRMVTMIDAAESARNSYTALADRAARIYAPVVHLLAFAAFAGWIIVSGDARLSINIAIAVLIITCPCALGLAVPAVSTAAAGKLFRAGILVKNGTALERIAEADVVVFDKTGTLTEGQLEIASLDALSDSDLSVALALAQSSNHPVAQAIALGLQDNSLKAAPLNGIKEIPGQGLRAVFKHLDVLLGSASFTGAAPTDLPGAWLRIGDAAPVHLSLQANLREGAREMVATLQARGFELHLISGDTPAATRAVAETLGITKFHAGQTPADKISYLTALAERGHKVLMVGDGLNDTGALASAYASVAPAAAADAARAASDVVLLGRSLAPLPELIQTARSAKRRILENFSIAAGYNALVIPLAVLGFVTPLLAAIAMSTSSITVLLNALRLSRRARQ
ncbi:heavy metal translocating P-type ATPase [Sulfitobacter sp. F26204]|uniref:heavy metal translocating P-type ATPase n=1 Tax=Sulfitobacter sp. F26204 TaxID=2996014 RepID=UPI00225E0485|nr:heavy metal translocating P-type ATPase [Sulfitobacter sp. F26204]MCX7560160.1 heavy metal translocating P-type ATPase [Sulfitobacter sp. F26204]